MNFARPIAGAALFLSLVQHAAADDIDAASRVDTVRLFADRAEIVRAIEFATEAGRHRLIVGGLPDTIMPESLQLLPGEATGPVELGQVSLITRPIAGARDADVEALLAEIEELERQKARQHDLIAAEEAKLAFIRGLSAAGKNGEAAAFDLAQIEAIAATIRGESHAALAAITDARERIAEIDETIELKRRQIEQLDSGARAERAAAIDIAGDAAASGGLQLVYQVRGGSWQPLMDARLDTGEGALTISQFAMVEQNTGEDWDNVRLEFSTATPVRGGLPTLEPWVIDVRPEPVPYAAESARPRLGATRGAAMMADSAKVERPQAAIENRGMNTSFVAAGRVSVPSGRGERQIFIGDWPQEAEIGRRAIPRIETKAYLSAAFVFDGPAPLPGADTRLFRDGGYIGSAWLDMLVPGSRTELEFGHDDRIEIAYRLDRDGRSSEGIVTDYERLTRNYVTTVTNRHDDAVEIAILDQHPVSRDERIEVETTARTTPPDRREVEGRAGVLAWDLQLAPGEEREIVFGYSVVHPADLETTHF